MESNGEHHCAQQPLSGRVGFLLLRSHWDKMAELLSDWFMGLSKNFLQARTARLLVLAGTDRLDKELMIGQMQGKFQMVVVPNVGHMVHEVDL